MAGDNSENPYDAVLQLKRGCETQPRSTNLEAPNNESHFHTQPICNTGRFAVQQHHRQ